LDDGDLEVEDGGSLWLAGRSKVVAAQSSNIQTQLTHVLVEGGSSISIESNSSWMLTQEFDFTPAQGRFRFWLCSSQIVVLLAVLPSDSAHSLTTYPHKVSSSKTTCFLAVLPNVAVHC
jgi:hypothetical protein